MFFLKHGSVQGREDTSPPLRAHSLLPHVRGSPWGAKPVPWRGDRSVPRACSRSHVESHRHALGPSLVDGTGLSVWLWLPGKHQGPRTQLQGRCECLRFRFNSRLTSINNSSLRVHNALLRRPLSCKCLQSAESVLISSDSPLVECRLNSVLLRNDTSLSLPCLRTAWGPLSRTR